MGILSYQTPGASKPPGIPGCAIALLAVDIAVNTWLLIIAGEDRSWGALQILFFIGPLANFLAISLSLALVPVVRRISRESVGLYTLLAFLVPTFAIGADAAIIMMMGVHGC